MFWEPSTPWFPQGNQSPSPPTEGDPEVGKTGTLASPPARLPLAFFQIKTDMWRFPPSLSGCASLQTDEKEPAVHRESAERSAALCSPLSPLLQHPPHAGTTAASVVVQPANNLQRAINFPLHDGSFLLLCFSLPPALSALPSLLFFCLFFLLFFTCSFISLTFNSYSACMHVNIFLCCLHG